MKFRRQHPISQLIAYFYCHDLKLVIEVDGAIHFQKDNIEYDHMRTTEYGIQVTRFINKDVIENTSKTYSIIENLIGSFKNTS